MRNTAAAHNHRRALAVWPASAAGCTANARYHLPCESGVWPQRLLTRSYLRAVGVRRGGWARWRFLADVLPCRLGHWLCDHALVHPPFLLHQRQHRARRLLPWYPRTFHKQTSVISNNAIPQHSTACEHNTPTLTESCVSNGSPGCREPCHARPRLLTRPRLELFEDTANDLQLMESRRSNPIPLVPRFPRQITAMSAHPTWHMVPPVKPESRGAHTV